MNLNLSSEIVETILRVAKRLAPKYAFGIHDADDLIQNAFLFGVDGYAKWDGVRPLENFISVHISNRLKNFKRDNYYRFAEGQTAEALRLTERKQRILEPIPLERTNPEGEPNMMRDDDVEYALITKEFINRIDNAIPKELRSSWKRMQDGAYVSPSKRFRIYDIIREVLNGD